MSQNWLGQITDTFAEDGADLADRLNKFDTAHKSNQMATARPSGIAAGGLWSRDNEDGTYSLMIYDGATDLEMAQTGLLPFIKEYKSGGQAMVSGGLLTLPHGLGAVPKLVSLTAVCTTAEHGYTVGMQFNISAVTARGVGASNKRAFAVVQDATNILIRNGADGEFISTVHANTGQDVGLNRANWELYVEAWA
jgi:hypothetical protein